MQRVTANLSVLFAEILYNRRLHRKLNQAKAQRRIKEFLRNLSGIVYSTNGGFIQAFNDKLLCTFFSADDAVTAAATMHQFAYTSPSFKMADDHAIGLQIRIGTGVVVREGKRLYGEAVAFAEKMKAGEHAFQILLSEATRNCLSRAYADQTRFVGQWPINGSNNRLNVYEFIADVEDETLAAERPSEFGYSQELDLILGAIILTVDERCPLCTIGRQAGNDIIMKYPRVSRRHAKIEKRKHKFILKDTSSNGTYVKTGDFDTVCIKNDEIQLIGKGVISPGRQASSSSPGAIHYHLR